MISVVCVFIHVHQDLCFLFHFFRRLLNVSSLRLQENFHLDLKEVLLFMIQRFVFSSLLLADQTLNLKMSLNKEYKEFFFTAIMRLDGPVYIMTYLFVLTHWFLNCVLKGKPPSVDHILLFEYNRINTLSIYLCYRPYGFSCSYQIQRAQKSCQKCVHQKTIIKCQTENMRLLPLLYLQAKSLSI